MAASCALGCACVTSAEMRAASSRVSPRQARASGAMRITAPQPSEERRPLDFQSRSRAKFRTPAMQVSPGAVEGVSGSWSQRTKASPTSSPNRSG